MVYTVGFVINRSLPHLGCSPDIRVYDPSEYDPWELLEIKCSPSDYLCDLNYLKHTGRTVAGIKSAAKQTITIFGLNGVTYLTSCQGIAVSCFIMFCRRIAKDKPSNPFYNQRCLERSQPIDWWENNTKKYVWERHVYLDVKEQKQAFKGLGDEWDDIKRQIEEDPYRDVKRCKTDQHRMKCLYCDNTFSRKDGMKMHMKKKHPEQSVETFICSLCMYYQTVCLQGDSH